MSCAFFTFTVNEQVPRSRTAILPVSVVEMAVQPSAEGLQLHVLLLKRAVGEETDRGLVHRADLRMQS